MKVWRTIPAKHEATPFHAPRAVHRWNTPASRITYASLDASLAVVEKLALVRTVDQLANFVLIEANYTGTTQTLGNLPNGWDALPHGGASQVIGDAWCTSGATGALLVPSAIVPGQNVLLNQDHDDFRHLRLHKVHSLASLNRP